MKKHVEKHDEHYGCTRLTQSFWSHQLVYVGSVWAEAATKYIARIRDEMGIKMYFEIALLWENLSMRRNHHKTLENYNFA